MHRRSQSLIQLIDVSKSYPDGSVKVDALRNVSLIVPSGQFLAIKGPSGAGKTTLNHIIGGILKPDIGSVFVNGKDIAAFSDRELSHFRNKNVGFIFQKFELIPNYSVIDNVSLPLLIAGIPLAQRMKLIEKILKALGIDSFIHRSVDKLSGGERQRVAIARSLVNKPLFLLADEPTGSLDSENGISIVKLFRNLSESFGQTIIMITHDDALAARADKQIVIRDGQIAKSSVSDL
jgi:putative ABC transport system ATP-binding protein